MAKKETTLSLISWLDKFIAESKNGKRLQKNGKRITDGTIDQYQYLSKLLEDFETAKQFPLRIKLLTTSNARVFETEKNYWKKFYRKFTDYLYDDLGCFDNYVGCMIKTLRVFFNYLSESKGMPVGSFHKQFYVPKEDISIVVVTPEQLNYLIYDKTFEQSLSVELDRIKDIFVVGCTVALRFSDLMNLKAANLEIVGDRWYLQVRSKKTQTYTRVLLPEYAKAILKKYKGKHKTLLPAFSKDYLNAKFKELGELAGWTTPLIKTRNRRGVPITVYKEKGSRRNYRFCDSITTHTMRRSAITTMLTLGMPEYLVRKISGHAPNSKEFFRYVSLAQSYMDNEISQVFDKLAVKKEESQLVD
ncbi:tyrosine-type recombinase/integrase [Cytophagaceae bacterium YF14B1]|uniref:Tyrosine-type recombinase/integrase n=1 Tax=Xanthocytophaga flava TaxID=3048013 RepID=A0AAE3UD27_9BACT|nr:tyrosine-type recombinase/integrase [Xanthocytophaga flavus]MDJ1486108.1 tyrosine-type recombinase/integrase [Xanthocytophaga flavus]